MQVSVIEAEVCSEYAAHIYFLGIMSWGILGKHSRKCVQETTNPI